MIVRSRINYSFTLRILFLALLTCSIAQAFAVGDGVPGPSPSMEIGPVCQREEALCVSVFHDEVFNSSDEAHFKVRVSAPLDSVLEKVKVKLWMNMGGGHGHGSSPVKMTKLDDGDFQIDRAYFVMPGQWLIKVSFEISGSTYAFELPAKVD